MIKMLYKTKRLGTVIKIGLSTLYIGLTPEFNSLVIKHTDRVGIELNDNKIIITKLNQNGGDIT